MQQKSLMLNKRCSELLEILQKIINCSGYNIMDTKFSKMKSGFSRIPFLPYRIDSESIDELLIEDELVV